MGFEPTISAGKGPQTHVLDRAATWNGRQTEVHTAKPLVSKPSAFDVKTRTERLGRYKSAGTDEIAAELIQAEGRAVQSETLTYFVWNKEEFPQYCKG